MHKWFYSPIWTTFDIQLLINQWSGLVKSIILNRIKHTLLKCKNSFIIIHDGLLTDSAEILLSTQSSGIFQLNCRNSFRTLRMSRSSISLCQYENLFAKPPQSIEGCDGNSQLEVRCCKKNNALKHTAVAREIQRYQVHPN